FDMGLAGRVGQPLQALGQPFGHADETPSLGPARRPTPSSAPFGGAVAMMDFHVYTEIACRSTRAHGHLSFVGVPSVFWRAAASGSPRGRRWGNPRSRRPRSSPRGPGGPRRGDHTRGRSGSRSSQSRPALGLISGQTAVVLHDGDPLLAV